MTVLTINTPEDSNSSSIIINGIAPAQKAVDIYLDNVLQTTLTSNKTGDYSGQITLAPIASEQVFNITAKTLGASGEELTAKTTVFYQQNQPVLTALKLVQTHGQAVYDLLDLSNRGVTIAITHYGSKEAYKFIIEFTNPEMVDKVYVTSVRNKIKKSIEAFRDEETGQFIANDYFDENDHMYVPGVLGAEYTVKKDPNYVGQTINWSNLYDSFDERLQSSQVELTENTENNLAATITLDDTLEEIGGTVLNTTIKLYDEEHDTNIEDFINMSEVEGKLLSYIVPGLDDSRYIANLKIDSKTVTMVTYDALDVIHTAQKIQLLSTSESDPSYADLFSKADGLSSYLKIAQLLFKASSISDSHNSLCEEIMQSDQITDKTAALEDAEELKNDQMVYTLMTTVLTLIAASGGTMAGPAILFGAIMGVMDSMSSLFYNIRTNQIKGGSFKICWHIDPSGYVYEGVTSNRLVGVTATAYCVEYDGSDTFWDKPPVSGSVWNASEWSQLNPQATDSEGRYAWDVPEGWWQVKYELEGYETAYSAWLEVPPPQTEVNVGLISNAIPTLYLISVHEGYIEIEFNKYMTPQTVSSISISDSEGKNVGYNLEYSTDETDVLGNIFSKIYTLRFKDISASIGDEFVIHVPDNSVSSYAGIFVSQVDRNIKYVAEQSLMAPEPVSVAKGDKLTFKVQLVGACESDVIFGISESSAIASIESISELDENGYATVTLCGNAIGETSFKFTVPNTTLSCVVDVTVIRLTYMISGDYKYTVSNNTTSIIGYTGNAKTVVIPSTINEMEVTSIGTGAFDNSLTVINIYIPTCVSLISANAFSACENLQFIYFMGNAPTVSGTLSTGSPIGVMAYYRSGTSGWDESPWSGNATAVVPGDLNGDGRFNMADAVLFIQRLAQMGTYTQLEFISVDITRDGAVNMADIVKMVQALANSSIVLY